MSYSNYNKKGPNRIYVKSPTVKKLIFLQDIGNKEIVITFKDCDFKVGLIKIIINYCDGKRIDMKQNENLYEGRKFTFKLRKNETPNLLFFVKNLLHKYPKKVDPTKLISTLESDKFEKYIKPMPQELLFNLVCWDYDVESNKKIIGKVINYKI